MECVVNKLCQHELVVCRRLNVVIVVRDVEHLPMVLDSLQDGSAHLGSVIVYCSQEPGVEVRIPNGKQELVKCHNFMEWVHAQLCADGAANGISELVEILLAEP